MKLVEGETMRYLDAVKMARVHWILVGVASLTFACSGDTVDTDGGIDATLDSPHDSALDAPADTAKEDAGDSAATDSAATDSAPDALADGGTDAPNDAPDDAPPDAGVMCDGGCTLFSYECKMGQFPACTCIALSGGEVAPTCDAGMVSCFKDPCQTKTAACVNNQCVVQ